MGELEVISHTDMLHNLHVGYQANAVIDARTNANLLLLGHRLTCLRHLHTLFHCHLVELTVVVQLLDALWAGFSFEVHKGCVIIWQALIILDVAKDVEELLVVVLRVR